MKLSIFVAALMVLFLTACGGANMGEPETPDCEFGLDGNGNCLKEGADPRPAGH
ncbi:hypothetical protein SAMN05216419_10342 [Nitrosomonas cryotolerans]|uniref:Lipoprotein n=1 Tax=Nitrosomonas cryotolerans ATCC 49181 TaxID=1131553 RepID=A0A1N6J3E6_9PROT|nr:hypothetical protein [Nitrosomonas cryotolerans]SFP92608.1 hypothetical protein SAMN05216419_10342 [Nitrosomonas cryotolerans]SIO38729.1 hypothetical protein SAMN02743940_2279 [Nitrosomonas cryotolerans ATCC 49181]